MIRITTLALGLTLLAASATAAQISVPLAGKSPAQLGADIATAAHAACFMADNTPVYQHDTCEADTTAAALAKVQKMEGLAKAKASSELASNATAR